MGPLLVFLIVSSLPSPRNVKAAFEQEQRRAKQQFGSTLQAFEHCVENSFYVASKCLHNSQAKFSSDVQAILEDLHGAMLSIEDRREGIVGWVRSRLAWHRAGKLMRDGTEDLSGAWRMQERQDMQHFLKSLGFSPLQRAAVMRAGQVQVIGRRGDTIHIITRDIRGHSELVLPLDGESVLGEGDGRRPVRRAAFVDGGALVITETADGAHGSEEPISVCRRYLQADGRMCVDVRKRTPVGDMVSMRVIFSPLASHQSID